MRNKMSDAKRNVLRKFALHGFEQLKHILMFEKKIHWCSHINCWSRQKRCLCSHVGANLILIISEVMPQLHSTLKLIQQILCCPSSTWFDLKQCKFIKPKPDFPACWFGACFCQLPQYRVFGVHFNLKSCTAQFMLRQIDVRFVGLPWIWCHCIGRKLNQIKSSRI